MNPETTADALFGIPKDYVYLLVGMGIGFLLGWLTGRLSASVPRDIDVRVTGSGAVPVASAQPINLVINGRTVNLDAAQAAEIQGLVQARKMIEAIKRLREITGLGLAEAKAVAESIAKVGR